MSIKDNLKHIQQQIPQNVTLVSVSKTKPIELLQEAYDAGQRVFGENKIQEMTQKWEALPKDIEWHMIGHLQRNKVKYMAEYVHLIHAVDSLKLLQEINKQAKKHNRVIHCLLQIKIAQEDTKFGLTPQEASEIITNTSFASLKNICITGIMGMATFTDNQEQITAEFNTLKDTFNSIEKLPKTANFSPKIISMGMSGDFKLAIDCGSTMVRVGSSIFGNRN